MTWADCGMISLQGEYIAAERLENSYSTADLVDQIWVYGNSYESQLVAVVVPNVSLSTFVLLHL